METSSGLAIHTEFDIPSMHIYGNNKLQVLY